jgi:predicted P-loop ATPase
MSKEKSPKNNFVIAKEFLSSQYVFRNNTISNTIEMKLKDEDDGKFIQCNDSELYCLLKADGFKLSQADLRALLLSSFVIPYNPLESYFNKFKIDCSADEHSEIENLTKYITVKKGDEELFKLHFKKALVRTVACTLNPKVVNKQAFVLVSGIQNIGKTHFIRFLVPDELKDYYTENIGIDKDSRIALCENFIINMDELATISKKDLNSLKSILSKESDKSRRPYDSREIRRTRTASFFGSTNEIAFLNDHTGSVRWLCFEIESIDFEYSKEIDIDKVWAEAYRLYKSGYNYQLTKEEIEENDKKNRNHQILTTEMELITKYFEPGTKEDHSVFFNTTDIVKDLTLKSGLNTLNINNVGKALSMLGFPKGQVAGTIFPFKGYYIKYK